jgi:hypothetical protein
MAGLGPAIQLTLGTLAFAVDGRLKCGHDSRGHYEALDFFTPSGNF